jgi:hypothetical protein
LRIALQQILCHQPFMGRPVELSGRNENKNKENGLIGASGGLAAVRTRAAGMAEFVT